MKKLTKKTLKNGDFMEITIHELLITCNMNPRMRARA